jgi:hypothetical protein
MKTNKNIFLLPTDKPSRIALQLDCKPSYNLQVSKISDDWTFNWQKQNIYITNDEEIKEGSIVKIPCGVGRVKELHWKYGNHFPSYIVEDIFAYKLRYGQKKGELQTNSFRYEDVKKIILTTDQDLIKDGVQTIDDEFLEWFVNNSNCESVDVNKMCYGAFSGFADACYKIIIPEEKSKQEELDCPFDFTSRCTMGRCDCKTKQEQKQHLIDLMKLDEELGLYEEPEQEKERGITINHIGKQETPEEGLLQHIKFCLECKNESQAIRLIEKYGFEKQDKNKYSEQIEMLWLKYRAYTNNEDAWCFKEWLIQFKKK